MKHFIFAFLFAFPVLAQSVDIYPPPADPVTSAAPSGAASGDLAGSYPSPTVSQARGLRETSGPTTLTMSSVANGQCLVRSGTTVTSALLTDSFIASANLDGSTSTYSMRTLGTGALQAAAGNDSRFTNSRAPNGSATGDLTGSYPAPTIAALAVTDAKVAAANKDGLAATPSMRTLGTGATQAAAGNDSRLSDSRAPSGSASGDLGGSFPSPTVTQARGIRETSGPTTLTAGSITDGQVLKRSGSTLIGISTATASGLATLDGSGFVPAAQLPPPTLSTLTYAASVAIDVAATAATYREITLTGNLTLTTTNKAAGQGTTIFLIGDSVSRTLTFPAWRWMGGAPTTLAANKIMTISIICRSTTDASVVASYSVEL